MFKVTLAASLFIGTSSLFAAQAQSCVKPAKPQIDEASLNKQNESDVRNSTLAGTAVGGTIGSIFGNNSDSDDDNGKKGAVVGGALGGIIGNRLGNEVADRRTTFVYSEADLRYRNDLASYYVCTSQEKVTASKRRLASLEAQIASEKARGFTSAAESKKLAEVRDDLQTLLNEQRDTLRDNRTVRYRNSR